MQKAVDTWKAQLIDTGGRNRLLYFRDLRAGTADLTPDEVLIYGQYVDQLIAGKKVKTSDLGVTDEVDKDLLKRCKNLYRKAQENLEEKGLDTLLLGVGLASWASDKKPAAPVLLLPVTLAAVGAGLTDFSISISGDGEINPTMLHFLAEEFGVTGSQFADDLEEVRSLADIGNVLSEARSAFGAVPEFQIQERIVLGNFTYTTLPMVMDLQESVERLEAHSLVAAIAGDASARDQLRSIIADVGIGAPNTTPPADEYLVLDADASQNWAINATLSGQSIVIEGPPGTGKSQTIANLISSLVARKKKVLFVAEKRAAIEAVTKRLNASGLEEIVFDLHGGVKSKRELAQSLARSLDSVASIGRPDTEALDRALVMRRDQLNAHAEAIHKVRQPWGLSAWRLQEDLIGFEGRADLSLRLSKMGLDELNPARIAEVVDLLREWVALGGADPDNSAWDQKGIVKQATVDSLVEDITSLEREDLPEMSASLHDLLAGTTLTEPKSVVGWQQLVELLVQTSSKLDRFDARVFSEAMRLKETLEPRRSAAKRLMASISSSEYRAAVAETRGFLVDGSKPKLPELLDELEDIVKLNRGWAKAANGPTSPARVDVTVARHSIEAVLERIERLAPHVSGNLSPQMSTESLTFNVQELHADMLSLRRMPRRNEIAATMGGYYLASVLAAVANRTSDEAIDMFGYAWRQSAYERLLGTVPHLATFSGDLQDDHIRGFQENEREHFAVAPHRILRSAAELAVDVQTRFPRQAELVKSQAGRKRKHLPLRSLLEQAPDVLTALRPCWAMSPILVAQLLPRSSDHFDVVIFDEASQIVPAHAISALSRAKTAVIAGDRRQLPPTSFFGVSESDSDLDDEDDTALTSSDFESVMDVMSSVLRSFTLTWHYRSKDERLIAFSNRYIYENMLTTFPGPEVSPPVSFVEIPHRPSIGQSTRSNTDEVAAVAAMVLEHARERPDESLGVIAMGIHHANNIDDAVQRLLADERDSDVLDFFRDDCEERFFVKNLERVQGDERESIILSVGYGKNDDGRLLYRFGPINGAAGERRLNVAVSRARARMTLVASFSSRDLSPEKATNPGVLFLRNYLQFAESGATSLGDGPRGDYTLNPFELDVLGRLRGAGLEVHPQYGVGSYSIDFAIGDPEYPGRMVLAVEADGATYHSTPTARDRDRLRQEVLERKGWRFHRIWSTDYFRDPVRAIEGVLASYNDALYGPPPLPGQLLTHRFADLPGGVERSGVRPRIIQGNPISEYSTAQLVSLARWVSSDGLLRTDDQLFETMFSELGYGRRGERIKTALLEAIGVFRAEK